MKLQQTKTTKLVPAKYNPSIRVEKKHIKSLMASIKDNGILYPILVDRRMNVIDGHRRLACAKLLKINTVPVVISDSDISNDKCYETINTTARKMSPSEMIYVYVSGGVVPAKIRNKIKKLDEIIGLHELKRLGNKFVSIDILSTGKKIGKYCKDESSNFIKTAILWAVRHKQTYQVRRAIEDSTKPAILKKAIQSDRPLKHNWK